MGDYLTRLVQRTLGMAPVVRPAIAPLYAPGPVMTGAGARVSEEAFPGEVVDTSFSLEDIPVVPQAGRSHRAMSLPAVSETPKGSEEQLEPGPSAPPNHLRGTPRRQPESQAERARAQAPPEAREIRRDGKPSAVFATPQNPSPALTLSGPKPRIPTSVNETEAALPARENRPLFSLPLHPDIPDHAPLLVPPHGERSGITVTREAAPEQGRSQAAFTASADSLPSSPDESPAQQIFRPRVVLSERQTPSAVEAPTKGDRRRGAPESATAAPTIRVTIGRVEVRANLPPTAAARSKPARPGPMLSLDDYLKRRNEGRR